MNRVENRSQRILLFEKVCTVCGRELQGFIYTMTRSDPFAMEEIYQNTMLGALAGLEYLRDIGKMKSWLFSIAKAEARRYYAAIAKAEVRCCHAPLGTVTDFTKSVEDSESVKKLIGVLSDEEQLLCILHYYYDLPLKKISEKLNVNYNTVRSMHMRGISKMRKALKELASW